MQPSDGRVVVITGASSGIGRLTAREFAARGDKVVLAARSPGPLEEAAGECRAAGGQALVVPTDVADGEAVEALARQAIDTWGRIDVWVNNAGVMVYGRFHDVPADVRHRVLETNLVGQINGACVVLSQFERQGYGVLINVASLYARMTSPLVSAYVMTKFGVFGLSEVLRQEFIGHDRIHICTILPASVDTPIFRHAGNYVGQGTKPIPPVIDPRRVVRAIVRCVDHPRAEVVVGQTGRLLSWGHALFPRLYDKLAPKVIHIAGLSRDSAPMGPGNVLEPVPELNRVTGDWRRRRNRVLRRGAVGLTAAAAAWSAARTSRRRRQRWRP